MDSKQLVVPRLVPRASATPSRCRWPPDDGAWQGAGESVGVVLFRPPANLGENGIREAVASALRISANQLATGARVLQVSVPVIRGSRGHP